ncbi:MAG: hypothetical protein K2Q13_01540 [Nitrosomonas sp.]|uniref:hypothetical protein n=1 Tax=Nitrosomonas sp. TaxID=42353 RepID=UPI0025EB281B|nr:hypothetical protein [Nitrosomonas sp.]MBY0473725.1 hypothetical protein [Nitrosomonas sp.]
MAVNFTAWLQDTTAIRCILVEAVSNIAGVDTTHYSSTKAYIDETNNRIYEPIVSANSIQLIERMSIDSSPSMSFGDVEIYNLAGSLDIWLTYIWVNKPINIYVGDVRWLRSDFVTIFSGTIEDIDSRSAQTLNIKVRDKLQRLNTPITETKLGGSTPNKNEIIPLCFGECFNVSPLLSNPATLEFQTHQSAIEENLEVRVNGVPVGLVNDIAHGKFTLPVQPFGKVTLSVQGDKPASWNTTVSSIIQRIVQNYGGANKFTSGDLDSAQLSAFDSAHPQPVGIYISARENTLGICNQLASSVGAQLVMSRLGKLQLLKLELPAPGTPFDIGPDDIFENTIRISRKLPVKAAFKVNYNKNWTIQPELLTGIPESHKKIYATEYASVTVEDATVKSNYALDSEPIPIDTLLLTASDSINEGNRSLNLYKTPRFVITFVGKPRLVELFLGRAVTLTYPRFGLDSGKDGQVIGLSIDWSTLYSQVEVFV